MSESVHMTDDKAIDAAISAIGWTGKRMIADARKIASGVQFETYGFEGDCCLTGPQVASFRSCLDGARAAIRLLYNETKLQDPLAVDWVAVGHEYAAAALSGGLPQVQSPQYALAGAFTAMAREIERLRARLATTPARNTSQIGEG